MSFYQSSVLITGAKGGLGIAIMNELFIRGAQTVYMGVRNTQNINNNKNARLQAINLDICSLESIQSAYDFIHNNHPINYLINNAGIAHPSQLMIYNEDLARQEMETNYFGPLNMIKTFYPMILQQEKNQRATGIINIISAGGLYPARNYGGYCASKAALSSLTRSLRYELTTPVYGIYPGPFKSKMTTKIPGTFPPAREIAKRMLDGIEAGFYDITTDVLSDQFQDQLKLERERVDRLKKIYKD